MRWNCGHWTIPRLQDPSLFGGKNGWKNNGRETTLLSGIRIFFRLTSELSSYTSKEKDAIQDKELMLKSRTQLEELVAKLQEEKVNAEEKMKTEVQRCE